LHQLVIDKKRFVVLRNLSQYPFEIGLGGMLLLTILAIAGERQILHTSLVIDTSDKFETNLYDDRKSDGNSTSATLDNNPFKWQCNLNTQTRYPHCGLELLLKANRLHGIDMRKYDTFRMWLDYEGLGKTVRVYLRNYDPAYSTPDVHDSTKFNQIEFSTKLLNQPVEFKLADFFVANWWLARYEIAPQQTHPQFDNITSIEIQTGVNEKIGEHRFHLKRIEFTGQLLSTTDWYQLIISIWFTLGVIYFIRRILLLKRELNKKNIRERELMEINALLDARGHALEELAKTDPLTGAFNRQGMKEIIKQGLDEWRNKKKPLSLIIIDLDHFKDINDNYGHAKGDQVLTELSLLVKSFTRSSDLFARWGGEEFVLVCLDTVETEAAKIADNLRHKIREHNFEDINVTASFGVATLKENESIEQLFIRADAALYQAKNRGRNQVVRHSDLQKSATV
jgi:diguanylate cyclase (GGDEF)-like protein